MSRTITIEHLARVEGHGGVTVWLDGGTVTDVRLSVFEGARLFEPLVCGRLSDELPQIVSRICAVCSAAHALTSIKATEQAFGVEVTEQTVRLRELLLRGESIQSHALHLFFLAAPDYFQLPSPLAMAHSHPEAVSLGLRLKQLGNMIQDCIGGRAIHPVNVTIGGFHTLPSPQQLGALFRELRTACGAVPHIQDFIASMSKIDFSFQDVSLAALATGQEGGYYVGDEFIVQTASEARRIPVSAYRELTSERPVAYSHAKHSSHDDRPLMVGALARLTANERHTAGTAAMDLRIPSRNPFDSNRAQAVELIDDIHFAMQTVEQLLVDGVVPEKPCPFNPRASSAAAATEAPRGVLIHGYTYDGRGRVEAADVITPTAINAAAIENNLRLAVQRWDGSDHHELRRHLEMLVRAFDPCLSCAVHLVGDGCAPCHAPS